MTDIDLTDVRQVHEHASQVQVLDVREPFEWEAGHIEGAVHVPLNTLLSGDSGGLDPERPVAVVCRTGGRSELAAMMLQARGFDAHNLAGGMERWAAEDLPFSAADGSPGQVA